MDLRLKKRILAGAVIAIFLLFVGICMMFINNRDSYKNAIHMDESWDVYINDKKYENKNLNEFTFDATNNGDVIRIIGNLPKKEFNAPMLRIWMYHAYIEVYVEDEKIYEMGRERYESGKMLESGYFWIGLPKDISDKKIEMIFRINENNAVTGVEVPVISEEKDAMTDFTSERFMNICASVFLVVFGILLTGCAAVYSVYSKHMAGLIYIGSFSLIIGVWRASINGVLFIISDDYVLNNILEYMSFYLGALPIILFFKKIRGTENKFHTKVINILTIAYLVLLASTILLHITDIVHLPRFLLLYHIFDILALVYLILSSIYFRKDKNKIEEKLMLYGMIMLAVCAGLDILFYNLGKYVVRSFSRIVGLSAWGCIGFVLCMLVGFASYVFKGITEKIERETLTRLAYTDSLTNLSNRAKYEEAINKAVKSGAGYTTVMFDLNDLKKINDGIGHAKGDLLLKSFAKILAMVFDGEGTACRLGGDEFLVLIEGCDRIKIKKLMEKYENILKKENEKGYGFSISAAFGVAYSDEIMDENEEKVLKLADKRLYANKTKMKAKMV